MRKIPFLISILILSLAVLTACSSASQAGSAQGASVADSPNEETPAQGAGLASAPGDEVERELPQAIQLALGTFKLEESDYAIDAEQANRLLPLWKAARSLSESETVATEELQAIVKQIQDTMTPEQLDLIQNMDLTAENMGAISEELGLEIFGGGRFGDISPEMQATMEAARASGQFPEGGFGGGPGGFPGGGPGGGGFGGDTSLSPEQRATAIAERGGIQRAGLGVPAPLMEAIIQLLEAKQ